MHRILIYVNSINQKVILGKNDIIVTNSDILDYEWEYTQQYNTIVSVEHSRFYENKVKLVCAGKNPRETADNLFRIIDYDAANNQYGRLYLCDYDQETNSAKNYYKRGFFIKSTKGKFHYKNYEEIELTFLADSTIWNIETTTEFNTSSGTITGSSLDFPHDFSYDYSSTLNTHQLINQDYIDTEFRMTIYGPASAPVVIVNGNIYKVDVELDHNEYLVIDSIEKTIRKIERYGNVVNCFSKRGKDGYIFEKIAPGTNNVSWNSDFKFDITLIEQRGEPKWT